MNTIKIKRDTSCCHFEYLSSRERFTPNKLHSYYGVFSKTIATIFVTKMTK